MNLPWSLKPTSIKWAQHFPLNFLLKPRWPFISMAFVKCSIIHPTASFSKPKTKVEPLLCSVIEHQVPPCSPSNLTEKVFLSTKTFTDLTVLSSNSLFSIIPGWWIVHPYHLQFLAESNYSDTMLESKNWNTLYYHFQKLLLLLYTLNYKQEKRK